MNEQANIEKHPAWVVLAGAIWGAVLLPLASALLLKALITFAPSSLLGKSGDPDTTLLIYVAIFMTQVPAGLWLGGTSAAAKLPRKKNRALGEIFYRTLGAVPFLMFLIFCVLPYKDANADLGLIAMIFFPMLWSALLLGRVLQLIIDLFKAGKPSSQVAR